MPEPPKEGESQDEFMSRCVKAFKSEGKSADKAKEMCSAMWYDHNRNSPTENQLNQDTKKEILGILDERDKEHEIIRKLIGKENFNEDTKKEILGILDKGKKEDEQIAKLLGVSLDKLTESDTVLFSVNSSLQDIQGYSNCDCNAGEVEKTTNGYRMVAVIGDRFMNGGFLSAKELQSCHSNWEGTLHDINHEGTSKSMLDPRPDITKFVGYHTNVKYNEETKEVTMDLNIVDETQYADAWKGFIALCNKAGITPNVSVTYMGKRRFVKAKDLPNGVDYEKEGYSENDYVPYLTNVIPICVSTVLIGKCNDKDGCGFKCSLSPNGETNDNNRNDEEKDKIIEWLKDHEI